MSNYELKSRLNQLESQLRQAERVNAELRGELSTVERGVSRAHKELEDYNDRIRGTLDNCNGTMTSSHQRVIDAIEVLHGKLTLFIIAHRLTTTRGCSMIIDVAELNKKKLS